jgi:8-oxo-dGTP pyrophosphatase MutT (NUDIX family)
VTLGARAVLIDGERVFLIRQTYLPGWQFCGGGVEAGESAELAARREMVEETGYRSTGPLQLFGLYHVSNRVTNRDHVALYTCRAFEQVKVFAPNREIAAADWFHIDDLPADTGAATRQRIAEIFRGAPPSSSW